MTALIELEAVSKTYAMGEIKVVALDNVSVQIPAGQFLAIMGASGSGKSTLMNVIGCLDRPTAGIYRLAGRPVDHLSPNELASIRNELIGFVFQHFNLLPRMSARENVGLPLLYSNAPARDRKDRALAALERVGLTGRANHTPSQLSGGQQQRVAIARAIVNDPKIILADEPTGALDSRSGMEIMELFQRLGRTGITNVIVTHEPDVGACAERMLTMRDGRIVADVEQRPVLAVAA